MRYKRFIALLLSSTVLAACASSSPQDAGETVIEGPQPPQIQQVEVPVYVTQDPVTMPKETVAPPPRDPLKVLAEVNRRSIRIPNPNDYIGTVYVVPTVPDIVYQIFLGEGQPTTIDLPPGETHRKVLISNPHLWEVEDGEMSINDDGEAVQTIAIRPYQGGLRNQSLVIKTNRTMHRFNISTYRGNTYHRGVRMMAPAKGLQFEPSDAPPGVSPLGAERRIPIEAGDYAYRTTGDTDVPWKPSAVFSHGGKTYIELPAGNGAVRPPQLVDTSTGKDRVVNWFVSGKRYMVVPDQVLRRAELRRDDKVIVIERERE